MEVRRVNRGHKQTEHPNHDQRIEMEKETMNVKRRLGFLSSVAFIAGTIIGSGIFISPKGVLSNTGSIGLCLIVWVICGVISMFASMVYVELGSLIPKSGAEHAYFLEAFGSFPAFMFVWVRSFVLLPVSNVIKSLTLAEYLADVIYDDCGPPDTAKKVIAATSILSVAITNCISVRLAARVQILFTFIKLSGLAVIVVGGVIWMSKGNFGSLETGFSGTTNQFQSIATAIYGGLYAYAGWANLNMVVEEVKNPKRNLPLAIIVSIILVTLLYLMVNVSYLAVLSKDEFLSSWAVGVTWGESVLGSGVILIPIAVASSVYASANGGLFLGGRLLCAAAKENHVPDLFSFIHVRNRIPIPSIILTALISFFMIIISDIAVLLNVFNFMTWLFYALSMIAVVVFRFKMKNAERVIKVPIFMPIIVFVFSVYLVIAPLLHDPKIEFLYTLAFLAAGVLVYFPFVFFRWSIPGLDCIYRYIQLLLEVVPIEDVAKQ